MWEGTQGCEYQETEHSGGSLGGWLSHMPSKMCVLLLSPSSLLSNTSKSMQLLTSVHVPPFTGPSRLLLSPFSILNDVLFEQE